MKLKKCPDCQTYTLKDKCECEAKTKSAHYKFLGLRDAPNKFKKR